MSSSCSYMQSQKRMRGFNGDEMGVSIYRSSIDLDDH